MKKDKNFFFQKKVELGFFSPLPALSILLSARASGRCKTKKKGIKWCSNKRKGTKG
jgi:hypothetical protein